MTIATKNGSPIIKGGSLATNCGCCGVSPLCRTGQSPPAGAITVSLESGNYRGAVQWGAGITITTAFFGEYTNGDFVLTLRNANGYLAWWSEPIATPFYTNVTFQPRIGFFPRGYLNDASIAMLVVPYLFFVEREDALTTGRSLEFFLNKYSTWTLGGSPTSFQFLQSLHAVVLGGCPGGIPAIDQYNGEPQQNGGINGAQDIVPSASIPKGRIAWGVNVRRVNSVVGAPFRESQPWIATRPENMILFSETAVGAVLGTGLLNSGLSYSEGDPNLWLTGIEENPLP